MAISNLLLAMVASFLAVSGCQAKTPAMAAGWEEYTIPRQLGGYKREYHMIEVMDRRAEEILGAVSDKRLRPSQRTSDLDLNYVLLGSALSADRAVYMYLALPYPRIAGMIGPEVKYCRVEIPLAAIDGDQSQDEAMRIADDIFRNGNCDSNSARSEEYYRLKEEQE